MISNPSNFISLPPYLDPKDRQHPATDYTSVIVFRIRLLAMVAILYYFDCHFYLLSEIVISNLPCQKYSLR
jgi:hypothetical protein